jgi:acyl-CoA synthetase (AMP-forming)/AMP-acid ligase II
LTDDLASVGGWLAKLAGSMRDSVAIIDDSAGVQLTFAELDRRCRRLAWSLSSLGLESGDRVAMVLPNCYASAELLFGISSAGMILVNINDRLTPTEVAYILADSQPKAIIAGPSTVRAVSTIIGDNSPVEHLLVVGLKPDQQPDLAGIVVHDYEQLLAGAQEHPPDVDLDPDATAMLIYTSGTTGKPKGVMLTQRNLIDSATNYLIESFRPQNGTYIACVPYFHVGSVVHLAALLRGFTVIVCAFEVSRILDLIERYGATHIAAVPTAIGMLLDAPDIAQRDLSSLQRVLYAASPMPAPILRRGIERLGPIFEQFYGLTETSGLVTILHPEDHNLDDADRLASCGREVARVSVRIVGADQIDARSGEPGEIWVRGTNVMAGYWNRPVETAEVMAGGWFRTGDVGVIDDDGFITIVDRLKDMIITGGTNVYPREVEEILFDHPNINDVAVIGVPHPQWGESVVAVIVPTPGSEMGLSELDSWCSSRMAGFKKPRRVEVVEALPRNAMGKVDKGALRSQYGKRV